MPSSKISFAVLLLIVCSLSFQSAAAMVCDTDENSFVDIADIRVIVANRNQPVSGADDPMDWDRNGIIDILDARGCVLACTLPRCAETPQKNNPMVSLDIKTFRFAWNDMPGATHYRLLENPDGVSGFSQVGRDIPPGVGIFDHIVALYRRINARYIFQTCYGAFCSDSDTVFVVSNLAGGTGYFKASDTGAGDRFGESISLSGDGNTLAVGVPSEDSNARGINGDPFDNSAVEAGAVYVFYRSGGSWGLQAYVKASNTDARDSFGSSLSLSEDGNTLAVGAPSEGSSATGINGNQSNNSTQGAGAVYVFSRGGNDWTQQAYIKASNAGRGDFFGGAVSLSGDGDTLSVGAINEKSSATGIDGDQSDDSISGAGAVYVFSRSGGSWSQQAYIKSSNTDLHDRFGETVALNGDGNTLAVGAVMESSAAKGIDGDQTDNSLGSAGAVYVFARDGSGWFQQSYLKASNTGRVDFFGGSISLSDDGNSLIVGAAGESSSATGTNGNQNDNSANWSGAAYFFVRSGSGWSQQAYLKASNTNKDDQFGVAVSLSRDGYTLAIAARNEASRAIGINGNQNDNSAPGAGAVYVFTRLGNDWIQQAYTKASNTDAGDQGGMLPLLAFHVGEFLALSGDGNTLAVGVLWEDSKAVGINGDQNDNSARDAGAVYLY